MEKKHLLPVIFLFCISFSYLNAQNIYIPELGENRVYTRGSVVDTYVPRSYFIPNPHYNSRQAYNTNGVINGRGTRQCIRVYVPDTTRIIAMPKAYIDPNIQYHILGSRGK